LNFFGLDDQRLLRPLLRPISASLRRFSASAPYLLALAMAAHVSVLSESLGGII
jgi:hypothetical protein